MKGGGSLGMGGGAKGGGKGGAKGTTQQIHKHNI